MSTMPSAALGRMWLAVGLAVVAVLAHAGCGEDEALPDAGVAPYTLEVQIGTWDFDAPGWLPLVDDSFTVRTAPFGEHYIIVHGRGRGFDPGDPTLPGAPENPETQFTAYANDVRVNTQVQPYSLGYVRADDDWLELPNALLLYLEDDGFPMAYEESAQVELIITDAAGLRGRDIRTISMKRACDPLTQDCKRAEDVCYLTPETDGRCCSSNFRPPAPGEPCSSPCGCAPGHGCVGEPFQIGTCRVYCDFASYPNQRDPDRCESNETCEPIDGISHVGQCLAG